MGITQDSINQVREATRIADLVGQDVDLKPGGMDSLKGLCPFHDEKTPSFHVRPSLDRWHCFGCGEGGDVISYVEKRQGMGFVEAVEYLADRAGITLIRDGNTNEPAGPSLARLAAANQAAYEFFFDQIADLTNTEAAAARDFIDARHLPPNFACNQWGAGYAPNHPTILIDHLKARGFTADELMAAGLATRDSKSQLKTLYRGRLTWPIFEPSGRIVGFGARRLDAVNDWGPKFINTPSTPLYKKDRTLFGLAQARKHIHATHTVTIVEGYTDVLAAHLAGLNTAVAACGTALTVEHLRTLHRLVGDDGLITICLDGDEAGLKAAARTLTLTQQVGHLRTNIVTLPGGADPNDILIHQGADTLKTLMGQGRPLIEFVIDRTIDTSPANNPAASMEDRIAGARQVIPLLQTVADETLRARYQARAATRLGLPITALTVNPTPNAAPMPAPEQRPAALGAGERDLVCAIVSSRDLTLASRNQGLTPDALNTRAGRTLLAAAQAALDNPDVGEWIDQIEAQLPREEDKDLLWATVCDPTPLDGDDLWRAIERTITHAHSRTLNMAASSQNIDLDAYARTRANLITGGAL